MDVIAEILKWGRQRPEWQQAALQMLYERRVISASDIESLVARAKKEQGLSASEVTPIDLELAGDASAGQSGPAILLGLEEVVNINALGRGQTLAFASTGLTLVFGDNGAGKSGYVRILKQVCRARGDREPVHPNAFADSGEPARATIRYSIGDAAPDIVVWSPATPGSTKLRQVSILDSKAAFVYVDGQQDVAYLPLGLDLFSRLAEVCGTVSSTLEQEIDREQQSRDRFTEIPSGTEVGQVLQQIDSPSAQQKLELLRVVSENEKLQAEQLRAEVATARAGQTEARSAELDLRARRIQAIAETTKLGMDLVGLAAEVEYQGKRTRAADLAAGAAQAAGETFAGFPLRGVGNESWNELWKAAREFAMKGAEPKQEFPPMEGHLCVLCQQPVGLDAAVRLSVFDRFIAEALTKSAQEASSAFTRFQAAIRERDWIAEVDAPTVEEIDGETKSLGTRAADVLAQLDLRRKAMLGGAANLSAFPADVEALLADLSTLSEQVRQRAIALRAAQDAEVLRVRQADLTELDARLTLGTVWGRIEAEMERSERIRKLRAANATTTTTGITIKAKELFDEAVTAPLATRFDQNVRALGLAHIPIEFAPAKGKKGMALHQVRLGGTLGLDNGDVLSEGEARAIAIAGFLAEVQLQGGSSTIVFDDPVSSLDLGRREFVAKALIGLAERRPVVVFTHDMPFAWQLHENAKVIGVTVTERQLRRTKSEAGLVSDSISGSGLGARKRIGPLKQRAIDLKKLETTDSARYEREARVLYGELREVWERGVEDVLLQGAVRRFGREIKTQSLGKLHLLREEHIERLDAGMAKCSGLLFGHDQPADLGRPIPDAAEVVVDVAECEAWLNELTKLFSA